MGRDESRDDDALSSSAAYDLQVIEDPDDDGRFRAQLALGNLTVSVREESGYGTIVLDWGEHRQAGGRERTGTHDPQEAIDYAEEALRTQLNEEQAREDAEIAIAADDEQLVLGQVTRLIRAERLNRHGDSHHRKRLELVLDLAEVIWGAETPYRQIGRDHMEEFIRVRTEEGVSFPPSYARDSLEEVQPSTALSNLKNLSSAFNDVRKLKNGRGERLVPPNPLRGIAWPSGARPSNPVIGRASSLV